MASKSAQDAATPRSFDPQAYLQGTFKAKGIGTWNKLYLRFLEDQPDLEILVVGAGAPDFVAALEAKRRVALDVGEGYRAGFEAAGATFVMADIETDSIDQLGLFDVVICSDVLEHLLEPRLALAKMAARIRPTGAFFAHVPNEFRLSHMLRVMLGKEEAPLFHKGCNEWDDPHLRRFTERGFDRFLASEFTHRLPIHDLKFPAPARLAARLLGHAPYALQPGPTFIATRDAATFAHYAARKAALRR